MSNKGELMKKYINLISLFTIIIFLTNCNNNSTGSTSVNELVGTWKLTEIIETMGTTVTTEVLGDDLKVTVIFNEDGTYSYTSSYTSGTDSDSDSGNGTWSTSNIHLTLIEEGETEVMDYSITGDVLTVSTSDTYDGVTTTTEQKFTRQ